MNTKDFLKSKKEEYYNFEETVERLKEMEIYRAVDYKFAVAEDDRLHPNPKEFFGNEWKEKNGWLGLIELKNVNIKNYYPTIEEASEACDNLGIKYGSLDYAMNKSKDPLLVSRPDLVYENFSDWESFLPRYEKRPITPRVNKNEAYQTIEEFGQALTEMGISTVNEFKIRRHENSKLVSNPWDFYSDWEEKGGWRTAMPLSYRGVDFYERWQEVKESIVELEIKTLEEYNKRYKEDPRLPSSLNTYFGELYKDLGGWKGISGQLDGVQHKALLEREPENLSMNELIDFCVKHKVSNIFDYQDLEKKEKRVPADPDSVYGNDWKEIGSMVGFLGEVEKKAQENKNKPRRPKK